MVKKKLRQFIKVFYVLPFVIGFYAYLSDSYYITTGSALEAAYNAILLYIGRFVDPVGEVSILLEFARWFALSASISGILWGATSLGRELANGLRASMAQSCVVYGDSEYAKHLVRNNKAIASNKFLNKAKRHAILFNTDAENIEFYIKHAAEYMTDEKTVAIMLNGVVPYSLNVKNIVVFSMAEITARLYWKNNPVTKNERIAIIGSGDLGQELLTFGLTFNIFSNRQCIEYHIWDNQTPYCGMRPEINKIESDKIIFHECDWREDFLSQGRFDRIILALETTENLSGLSQIMCYSVCHDIHVYLKDSDCISLFTSTNANINVFGTAAEISTYELIFKEALNEKAKRLHAQYYEKYPNIGTWEDLDGFYKRSNISAADFADTLHRLKSMGTTDEALAELEHIRWCRFYYLNNWSYAPTRDNANKKHNMLIPYADLPEDEKKKDLDNALTLLNL